jgi:hypothetical protein
VLRSFADSGFDLAAASRAIAKPDLESQARASERFLGFVAEVASGASDGAQAQRACRGALPLPALYAS